MTGRHPKWPARICAALEALGGEARTSDLYAKIKQMVTETLSPNWQSSVRSTLQAHCRDCPYFTGKEEFFEHKGHGIWALKKKQKVRQ
jgi:hypothetical protein